jgi:ubiquitin-protein ligase
MRLRRLQSDYEAVRRLVHAHPRIDIEGVEGSPPHRYRLRLQVASLRQKGEELIDAGEHRLEIQLPLGYPRDAPVFRMLTPVFHPNIAPHAVCIGDHWTAAESLQALIQRVGEMLAFQSYNVKSPLNGKAAQWVIENPDRVPTDPAELAVDLAGAPTPPAQTAAVACVNCGSRESLRGCDREHVVCADCFIPCAGCARPLCLACGPDSCAVCAGLPAG